MKKHLSTRLLSLLLIVAMLAGYAAPVQAAGHDHAAESSEALSFTKLENSSALELLNEADETEEAPLYADTELVRVSIVLDEKSTLEKGFSTENIAANAAAMSYRDGLKAQQKAMAASIESAIGTKLDVVRNLTLVANVISANVAYGTIDEIAAVPGVKEVFLETRYEPAVVEQEEAVDPNMATSGSQIGSNIAWANGYTGAGSRIAVIDTGIDTDHQSMSAAAFEYALGLNAAAEGQDPDAYLAGLDLLDAEEIASVLDQLHVDAAFSAESLYVNSKIAFGYNYIDEDNDIVHDNDTQGSHGSHVSGIATANAYIPNGDGTFSKALDTVFVQGVAPDAQLIAMKVFGKGGGAYDTDYMVAIEDAIILGCDAVNLSLGSASHGFVSTDSYQEVLEALTASGTVAVMSAGNNGSWATNSKSPAGLPYADDINFFTGGSPGTFVNSLAAASVQNAGKTGYYFQVADAKIYYNTYTKAEWSNEPLTSIPGDHEYIFIDGVGSEEDWAAVGDALVGKVAICSRGTTSFFQKGIAAVEAGAIATIIYNNQAGTINMDLTDYTKTEPCVSITQEEGALIKSLSTPVTDAEGNVLYYTGSMTVNRKVGTVGANETYYTMSTFSSWGVPTALILKPEITAPGGNIYSLNGVDTTGKAYENNSGTSMSAPQVTGMAAVVAEYIREAGLEAKTGLTVRQLAQSLLMSTAVPMKDQDGDSFYSVLNQGSGLANVGAAVTANSYIRMNADATASWADGKVKAELGDDPDRKGSYSFSFTLNNFSDAAKSYTLTADIFTQDTVVSDGIGYLDTRTAPVAAKVTYLVDGVEYVPSSRAVCDLDRDGDTDADDAQIILDYTVGQTDRIDAIADVNKDNTVNTYDAHLILASMNTSEFAVAALGKAEITVKVTLSDSVKAALDAEYVNGAYLEGYVFVEPTSSTEGVLDDVTHSIPVLGFYGSWTDASMYEKNTYAERLYGDTTPTYFDPGAEYSGMEDTNSLVVKFADDANSYYMVGNPYFTEESYPADRIAVSGTTTLKNYKITLLRNAAALASYVTNEAGEVIYVSTPTRNVYGAYYYTSGAAWRNFSTSVGINKTVEKLGISEGERISVGVVAVPEYYVDGDGTLSAEDVQQLIENGELGQGAYLSTSMMVDNTAPVVEDISKSMLNNKLTITASDENYLAAVQVTNLTGKTVFASVNPNQKEKGEAVSIVVDLGNANVGKKYLVTVADYAGNRATYQVSSGAEDVDYTGQMFAWTRNSNRMSTEEKNAGMSYYRWMKLDPDTIWYNTTDKSYTGTENFAGGDYTDYLVNTSSLQNYQLLAADYVEGFVVFALKDGNIYSAPLDDIGTATYLGNWSETVTARGGETVNNLRLNYADGYMYMLDDAQNFYRFDLHECKLEYAFTVTLTNPNTTSTGYNKTHDFAIHKDGTFYVLNKGYTKKYLYLYQFTLNDVQTYENADGTTTVGIRDLAPIFNDKNGYMDLVGGYNPYQMFWDHDKEILYMVRNYATNVSGATQSILYTIDVTTGQPAVVNSYQPEGVEGGTSGLLYNYVYGTFVVPSGDSLLLPGNQATAVTVSAPRTEVLVNASMGFSADVAPWNLNDKSVTWSSSDESIATINADGVATFTKTGNVTITATSVAKPHVQGSMDISVVTYPSTTLSAAVTGTDGVTHVAEFSTDDLSAFTNLTDATPGFLAGGLHEGKVYYHDGAQMYSVDAENQQITNLGVLASSWQWTDAASAPHYGPEEAYIFDILIGLSSGGMYIELITPEDGTLQYFDLSSNEAFSADPFTTICYAGPYAKTELPGYSYYVVRESGTIAKLSIFTETEGASFAANVTNDKYSYDTGIDMTGVATMGSGAYGSSFYDAATGYVLLTRTLPGEQTALYAVDPSNGVSALIGTFGEDIKLVNGLYMWDRVTDTTVRLDAERLELYMDETYELEAVVLPEGTDQAVTFTTSDEAVVTVSDTGVVTPISVGAATVTAETAALTAEGVPSTDSVSVTTKDLTPMAVKFNAQIAGEDGSIFWGEVDTATMTVTKLSDAPNPITSGGWHDGKIYGTDGDYTSGGYIYEIDPANGYAGTRGAKYSGSYVYVDGASAPLLVTDGVSSGYNKPLYETCDFSVNLSNSGAVLLVSDYTSGSLTGFNLASSIRGATAIALAGETLYKPTTANTYLGYEYYILENDGDLHRLVIYPNYKNDAITYNNRFTKAFANIGEVLGDQGEASMLFVDDGTNKGLLIAYSGNANSELYFVDMTSEYTEDETDTIATYKIGTLAGVTDLAAIHIPTAGAEEEIDPAGKMYTWTSNTTARFTEREKANGLKDRWMVVDPDTLWLNTDKSSGYAYTGTTNVQPTHYNGNSGYVLAAEYVNGNVIFAHNDGYLYSAPIGELDNAVQLLCWKDVMSIVNDMALNYQDGYLYILGPNGVFFRYNVSTNTLTPDYTVSTVCPNSTSASYLYPVTFAINDEGVFYAVNSGGTAAKYMYLYTWTLGDVVQNTLDGITSRSISGLEPINPSKTDGYTGVIGKAPCHMTWDHDKDILYIMGNSSSTSTGNGGQHANALLHTLDTATGKASVCTDYVPEGMEAVETGVSGLMYNYTRGLFVVPAVEPELPVPTDPPVSGNVSVDPAGRILGWNNHAARQQIGEKALNTATRWMAITPDSVWYDTDTGSFSGTGTYAVTAYSKKVAAAAYVDGTVYFASEDGCLYSAPVSDLNDTTQLAAWNTVITSRYGNSDYYVSDMAYNVKDGSIYLLNHANEVNSIYKYDIASNTLTLDYTVSVTNPAATKTGSDYWAFRGMTIDDEGNFYAVSNSRMGAKYKFLYKWTMDDVVESSAEDGTVTRSITDLAPVNNTAEGGVNAGVTVTATQLVWDSDKDVLYMFGGPGAWATTGESKIYLYTIDTATGQGTVCTEAYPEGMTDVGTPGMIFNYVRGAFYVPASYTAPEAVTAEPAVRKTAEAGTEVHEIIAAGEDAFTVNVAEESNAFVPGTESCASSVISLAADIRDLTLRSTGSTNAVCAAAASFDRSEVGVDAVENTVTEAGVELKLTETVDVTNGKLVITYDPSLLTYQACTTDLGSHAVGVDEVEGKLTFAYASADAIKADTLLAEVTFTYAQAYVNTTVTTETVERNDEAVTGDKVVTEVVYEVGGHDYQITDSKDATCTEGGHITHTCSKCGDSYTEELKAEGHRYEAVVTEATCTTDGFTTYTCGVCGDSYVSDVVEAKGHSYEAVVTEPTCTEMGFTTHTCTACGDSYVDSYVNPTGHSYGAVVTEPTCTAYGYTTYTCTCGERYVSDFTEPKGHAFGEWEAVTEPGCDTRGQQKRTCADCGECEYRDTDPNGHSYEAVVTAPTCTEMGFTTYTCAACGHSYKSDYVNPTGHSYEAVVTAPTCTEMGYTTYTCACGNSYKSDYVLPTGHNHEAVVTAPTCTEQGYTTYTCHCGDSYVSDYVDALGHSYGEWFVTVQESCTEEGEEKCVCAVCGDEQTRAIAAYCPSEAYTDLDAQGWYHEGVCYVLRNGLMKGKAEGIFAPAANLNRAELVTVLYRMAGSPGVDGLENPFIDVEAGSWYADAVIWAAGNGIVNGVSAELFAPGRDINREQIAAILYRYAKAEPVEEDHLGSFADADAVSSYAVDAMNWAVANGLINGMGGGTLSPAASANRAQIAMILMRFCRK